MDKKPTGPSPVKSSTINNNGYTISPPSSTRVSQQLSKYIITTDGININSPQSGYLKTDTREDNNTSRLYPNVQHYTRNNILKCHKKRSKFTKSRCAHWNYHFPSFLLLFRAAEHGSVVYCLLVFVVNVGNRVVYTRIGTMFVVDGAKPTRCEMERKVPHDDADNGV
ncbi:hypothetical protein PIB30_087452 [Stylosanthes scabra]|uniref:Uncharacterized protein n=1 Tax=Stylosanthes scabra TaxID=79078 RepID=A0ABU6WRT1_9FABA|nr:hypothetical protein [Stylosanthes scabra]